MKSIHRRSGAKPAPLTRRDLLRQASCGFGAVAASTLLHRDAARAASRGTLAALHHPARVTSVIFLYMDGGVSQVDSFDPKPSAPGDIRGEFSAIATRTPGVQVSEHLPRMAARSDLYSIIRSGYSYNGSHGVADAYMAHGFAEVVRDGDGEWVGMMLERRKS